MLTFNFFGLKNSIDKNNYYIFNFKIHILILLLIFTALIIITSYYTIITIFGDIESLFISFLNLIEQKKRLV